MDGIIFHMTELSIWAPILPVIPLRGSRVGIWLPETSNMQAVPAESQKSFHISSLDRRTVLPQLCRIVLPIGCVHLLGVYDKNMPKQSCILVLETTYPCPRHLTAVIWPKSPVPAMVLSSRSAQPLAKPASRRLLTLTLPRLSTRGSLIRSLSDSARCRCPPVRPADVRLKMARRPRREDVRVGSASLAVLIVCGVENSGARRFIHGDDEYGADTGLRDTTFEGGEEDPLGG